MMLFVAAFAAAASPAIQSPPWAEFSASPALKRETVRVEVGTLGYDRERKQLEYWMRRSFKGPKDENVTWTDSVRCPAVREVVRAMHDVAAPRPAPPGIDEPSNIVVTADGTGYQLRAPGRYGDLMARVEMSSNVGTPLARWVDSSLGALDRCWSDAVPVELRH
jgi:hypothetical protein